MAPLAASNVRLVGALHGESPEARRCVGTKGYESVTTMSKASPCRHHDAKNRLVPRKVDQASMAAQETPDTPQVAKSVSKIR